MAKPLAKLASMLKPKRRWAQFSLATMFVVVTVLCVWLAAHKRGTDRQRAALAAIKKLGGRWFYDYQLSDDGITYNRHAPPVPKWLLDRFGDSGNDLAMFLQDFRGVVVANAHQDLKDLVGPTVFVSRFSYADGVLDGLRHWLSDNLEA